jgi:hypothetical protein
MVPQGRTCALRDADTLFPGGRRRALSKWRGLKLRHVYEYAFQAYCTHLRYGLVDYMVP